jgi:hypothetical protein
MTDSNPMMCRLLYLVTPKPELFGVLNTDSKSNHAACKPTAVITPKLHYETHFEGWKRAWMSKAKRDFIREFVGLWSDGDLQTFTGRLRLVEDQEHSFDQWWTIRELDVIEIDPEWRPA